MSKLTAAGELFEAVVAKQYAEMQASKIVLPDISVATHGAANVLPTSQNNGRLWER